MNHQQQQTQIIENSLLRWISLLTNQKVSSFQQLTQGHFYLDFLKKIEHFKLIKPLRDYSYHESNDSSNNISLANKVLNIKIIGQSLIRYYQTYMMKDVSQMRINYVQLCMGNSSQSIKLFSLLIGIFVSNQNDTYTKILFESIERLESQDDQYIVKALLENTKTLGDSMMFVKKDVESPLQKKMISTLEVYEERIQELEEVVQSLRSNLEEQKAKNSMTLNQIKQLKVQRNKLIQKAEVLEVLNSKLETENSSFSIQNTSLLKKLESSKKHYEKTLSDMQIKISLYESQSKQISILRDNLNSLKKINEQLRQEIVQKDDFWKGEESKYQLMKQNYNQIKDKLKIFQEKYQKLQYEKFQFDNKYRTNEKNYDEGMLNLNQSSIQSSLKYRNKDRFSSALKNHFAEYQMANSGQFFIQKSKLNQIESNQPRQFIVNYDQYQVFENMLNRNFNISNFILNDSQQKSFCRNRVNQVLQKEEKLDQSIIIEDEHEVSHLSQQFKAKINNYQCDDENLMNILAKIQHQKNQQHEVLITTIQYLLNQNQCLVGQLSKYQVLSKQKQERLEIFKKKLEKIREIQPIIEIEGQLEERKENLMNESNKHLPLSLKSRKKEKSEKVPYYQVMHI